MRNLIAGLIVALGLTASPAVAQRVVPPAVTTNCAFNTSPPTVTSGQMVMIQCDSSGRLILSPSGSSTVVTGSVSNATSSVATTATNVPNVSYNYWWNGTTWDQAPGTAANGGYVQGSVASGSADNGNGVKTASVFMTTAPSLSNAQRVDAQADVSGNQRVRLFGGTVAGTDGASNTNVVIGSPSDSGALVGTLRLLPTGGYNFNGTTWDRQRGTATSGTFVSPGGFSYTHIATAGTTAAIKTGSGSLHTICVNTLGTVASTITVDDALTATTPTIAVINSLTLLGCQTYDVTFNTGLTIVTTGTVAPDVTVSWR